MVLELLHFIFFLRLRLVTNFDKKRRFGNRAKLNHMIFRMQKFDHKYFSSSSPCHSDWSISQCHVSWAAICCITNRPFTTVQHGWLFVQLTLLVSFIFFLYFTISFTSSIPVLSLLTLRFPNFWSSMFVVLCSYNGVVYSFPYDFLEWLSVYTFVFVYGQYTNFLCI